MGVNENIGSAASLASTGLIVLGASVPLSMMRRLNPTQKKRKSTRRRRRR